MLVHSITIDNSILNLVFQKRRNNDAIEAKGSKI